MVTLVIHSHVNGPRTAKSGPRRPCNYRLRTASLKSIPSLIISYIFFPHSLSSSSSYSTSPPSLRKPFHLSVTSLIDHLVSVHPQILDIQHQSSIFHLPSRCLRRKLRPLFKMVSISLCHSFVLGVAIEYDWYEVSNRYPGTGLSFETCLVPLCFIIIAYLSTPTMIAFNGRICYRLPSCETFYLAIPSLMPFDKSIRTAQALKTRWAPPLSMRRSSFL